LPEATLLSPGQQASTGTRRVGAYLVSPLVKALANGWFAGSVSLRPLGGGIDRVLRLTRLFRCASDAANFCHAEAARWIGAPAPATA
jgi:hypothetical protein